MLIRTTHPAGRAAVLALALALLLAAGRAAAQGSGTNADCPICREFWQSIADFNRRTGGCAYPDWKRLEQLHAAQRVPYPHPAAGDKPQRCGVQSPHCHPIDVDGDGKPDMNAWFTGPHDLPHQGGTPPKPPRGDCDVKAPHCHPVDLDGDGKPDICPWYMGPHALPGAGRPPQGQPGPQVDDPYAAMREYLGDARFADWLRANKRKWGNYQGICGYGIHSMSPEHRRGFELREQQLEQWLNAH